jgi:hypothetical protein
MFKNKKYNLFNKIIISAFLITACGKGNSTDPFISTAVAQTVAAQNTAIQSTDTPVPTAASTQAGQTPVQFLPTLTPFTTVTVPTLPGSTSKSNCAKASLASENIIDGTIFKPGTLFTKTWQITNTSNCVWDTSYKIVFWDGDVLGGGYVYNLPQVIAPGQTVPISLVLTAPLIDGTYRSEWKLQTPDKIDFGVGAYSASFYTEITVSSAVKPKYGIASVVTDITRNPQFGCPANTLFTVHAVVATTGPLEFTYYWDQKDGNSSKPTTFFLNTAGTKSFTREWKFGRTNTQGAKWISFVVTDPIQQEYRVDFDFICP